MPDSREAGTKDNSGLEGLSEEQLQCGLHRPHMSVTGTATDVRGQDRAEKLALHSGSSWSGKKSGYTLRLCWPESATQRERQKSQGSAGTGCISLLQARRGFLCTQRSDFHWGDRTP